MRMRLGLVMLALLLAPAVPARAAVPPPGSVQIFFDDYMQENWYWTQSSFEFITFKVLAFDLPDSIAGYRFRVSTGSQFAFVGLTFPDGVENFGSGSDYVLQVTGDCLGGRGLKVLATGTLLSLSYVQDAALCLEPVAAPGPTGWGIDFQRCAADTWEAMTLLYPGCAYINPWNAYPAWIGDNDPNAVAFGAAGLSGEPTDTVTLPLAVANILKSAGNPLELAQVSLGFTWDPALATYTGLVPHVPAGWTVDEQAAPGALQLTLAGAVGFNPLFSGTALVDLGFRLDDNEGSGTLAMSVEDVRDELGQAIAWTAPDSLALVITCTKGDVVPNRDINALDALLTLQFAAALDTPDPKQFCRADMNGNLQIDAGDAAAILRRAVGLPVKAAAAGGRRLEPVTTATALRFELGAAAGFDLTVNWDPSQGDLAGWSATPAFQGAERRLPGQLQLALARTAEEAATVELQFTGTGLALDVAVARTWDGEGALLADLGGAAPVLGQVPQREARLLAPRPNPFNPSTTFRFVMPATGRAAISVFDAQGRRVWRRELTNATAGLNEWPWDGLDVRGSPLASGVYLVELVTDTGRSVTRATLVR